MAPNQNNINSEGVCERIYNSVSGGRKIRLISHQIQGSVSSKISPKSRVQTSNNPKKTSLPGNKPVFQNQPCHRMIPIEFEPSIRPSPMSQKENMQTTAKNTGKDDGTKHVSELSVQERVTRECHGLKGKMEGKTHDQLEKVPSAKDKLPSSVSMEGITKLKGRMASMAKTKSTKKKAIQEKDDEDKKTELERSFSDYIKHVKNKMATVSNVGSGAGGGAVGRTTTRRDSFNNKVSSYIKRAKMKIRTTTNFDGKSNSFK
ncbi:Uncharacterized protein Adt_16231 [Abeliophyllum distichum]|uniref:Uncharacterized protein n=1 Tax=Abeliophyllum distichum TaxID=126358 RepID=A0ABD1TD28_9LAMI